MYQGGGIVVGAVYGVQLYERSTEGMFGWQLIDKFGAKKNNSINCYYFAWLHPSINYQIKQF
jgi:hypothetical protein